MFCLGSFYFFKALYLTAFFNSTQQVAPQAAKTMSPPFAPMGGYGGGSSNSFNQMPTGAAPTTSSNADYPQLNARANINPSGYGTVQVHGVLWVNTDHHDCYYSQLIMNYCNCYQLIVINWKKSTTMHVHCWNRKTKHSR